MERAARTEGREDDDGGEVEMRRVGVGESDEGKEAKSQERDES